MAFRDGSQEEKKIEMVKIGILTVMEIWISRKIFTALAEI